MKQNRKVGKKAPKGSMRQKDYEALAAFRYALRRFFRFSDEEAARAGLSIRQYQALLTIRGFPGRGKVTIGEIAEWLQIRHHSAVGLVNRLATRGFVVRRKSEEDRREVYLRITAKGKRILEKLAFLNKQELKRLSPHLQLVNLLSQEDG